MKTNTMTQTTWRFRTPNSWTTIKGDFTGNNNDGNFSWECPFTGEIKNCSGEFDYDENGYFHNVYDENDNLLYIVTQ